MPSNPEPDKSVLAPELAVHDRELLVGLDRKFQVVRDRVVGVARGYYAGTVITGRGGTSKSWTIVQTLEELGVPYQLHNTHITPRGLFDEFDLNPSAVHVIEDAEEVLGNKVSLGILRSATWGSRRGRDGRLERLITWSVARNHLEVIFNGGVILVSNRKMSNLPEASALATRIPSIDLPVTDQEIGALMHSVAMQGYRIGDVFLAPAECLEVADFVIRESTHLTRQLDMRVLVNGFADRLQSEGYDAGCGWRDLIASTLRGRPSVVEDVESVGIRQQRMARELEIARQIVHLPRVERLREWQEKTGASESSLYRRLGELGRIDALGY
jgi:hypothetical protein